MSQTSSGETDAVCSPPPQVSTCASVLRDTPAARRRWRRTSSSRANWTLRTWWKTAARVRGWPSSPGTRCLTVSSNHVCSARLKCGTDFWSSFWRLQTSAAAHTCTFLSTLSRLTAALEWHLFTHLSNKLPFLWLNTHGNRPGAPLIDWASIPRRAGALGGWILLACRRNKTTLMRLRGGGKKMVALLNAFLTVRRVQSNACGAPRSLHCWKIEAVSAACSSKHSKWCVLLINRRALCLKN